MPIKPRVDLGSPDIRPLRRIMLLGVVVIGMGFAAVIGSAWPTEHAMRPVIKGVGIALMIACITGRSWSRLYIGWHKTRRLVRVGPYSVCRNPLYVFSILGVAGASAQSGSIVIALIATVAVWSILYRVTLREEEILRGIHEKAYEAYLRDVPRFFPRLSLWRDVEMVEVRPFDTAKTFVESCLFLFAIPAFAVVEYCQDNGLLPVLFRLF